MFSETLSPDTSRLIEKIRNRHWLSPYYLAGGTALALHLGHRTSIDLDFEDADNEPMPSMITPCDRQDVKEYFVNEVKRLTKTL